MIRAIARWLFVVLLLVILGVTSWLTRERWLPIVTGEVAEVASAEEEHAHDHGAEAGRESIVLSDQARRNLGLKTAPVELQEFWSSISVPATVVEQPGHSHRKVAAPFTGMVKQLFIHPNQLVHPGDPIAELELSGDALATTQADLLQVVRELEVNAQEIKRVEALVKEGSIPEKNLLQLQYDRRRLETQRESKIQQLTVLGLTAEQVDKIESSKQLIRSFLVATPEIASEIKQHRGAVPIIQQTSQREEQADDQKPAWSYTVESIDVFPGKRVQIGDGLCSLAFHASLFIEGQAFEKEGELVARALQQEWPLTARFETSADQPLKRQSLKILFMDNMVDESTRTFRFFVSLPNEILVDNKGELGETYRSWRFKPGQKAELDVPIELFKGVIVLPADAVVKDGLDTFVFIANGNKFERQAVEVTTQVSGKVVIANNGSLFPGDTVAMNNAFQLNLAIKKASGQGGGGHGHEGHDHSGHDHAH
jgi:multidrug efflux pump subunit AcrA (membrane-fusion protein)